MNNSCFNIINGDGSHFDEQSIYGHLKAFETTFGQMAEMALECDKARKYAEPIIQKSESNPIMSMVEVAGTDFLDSMFQHYPYYYHYLHTKFYKVWQDVDYYPKKNND